MSRRVAILGLFLVLGLQALVQAQVVNPGNNPVFGNTGWTQAQYLANLQAMARAAQFQNPSVYPRPVNVYPGPAPGVNPVANPYTPVTGTDPYANPYTPVTSGTGYDGAGYNPYNPYFPYYPYIGPAGSFLMGQADVMRAYGTVITSQEQARIMRELAKQASLETKKRKFDLDMYIKANTPTYADEQLKAMKTTLKRIQNNSSEAEITNGKALNFLLDDLRKYPGRKIPVEQIDLSEEILRSLNVTKNSFGIGILRDGGKLTWPIALQELFPRELRKEIEQRTMTLMQNADNGPLDPALLRELYTEVENMRQTLAKKINDVPTTQYLEAKRFLNDLDSAREALAKGEATAQIAFQKWAAGGKTLQELVDYMVKNGLRFAPAVSGDEAAYRAVHSGMAAFDVALNAFLTAPQSSSIE